MREAGCRAAGRLRPAQCRARGRKRRPQEVTRGQRRPGAGAGRRLPAGVAGGWGSPSGAGNGRGGGDPRRAVRREADRHRGAAGEGGVGTGVFPAGGVIWCPFGKCGCPDVSWPLWKYFRLLAAAGPRRGRSWQRVALRVSGVEGR